MMLRRRLTLHAILLVAPALLLAGCGGGSESTAATTASTAHAYVLAGDTLTTYAISPSTGGLTAEGNLSIPFFQTTAFGGYGPITADPSGRFLYVPDSGNAELYAYSVNPDTGALTPVPGSPFESVIGASTIAFDVSDTYLYVTGNSGVIAPVNTLIAAYSIDSSGALTLIATYTVTGELGTLTRAGNYLYVAGFYTNSVTVFSIAPSGELTQVGSPVATDTGPYYIVADATASVLYTSNDGAPTATVPVPGSISAFTIDSSTGALTPAAGNPQPIPVQGAAKIVDQFLLVPETNGVAVYTIDSTSGALAQVAGSPFAAGPSPGWMSYDSNSQTVYVQSGSSPTLSVLSLANTGVLTLLPTSPITIESVADSTAIIGQNGL